MSRRRAAAFAFGFALLVSTLPAAGQNPPPPGPDTRRQALRDAERDLWAPGESRALRAWLVRAAEAPLEEEAQLAPTGPGNGWAFYAAWTDTVELSPQAEAAQARFLYAATRIVRAEAGPAELALGSRAPLRIWLNGERVGDVAAADFLAPDRVRIPVRLRAGENRLVVRAGHERGPARLTIRLLGPNQPVADVMAPSLAARPDGRLAVRTNSGRERPAQVAAFAPGGRLVGEATIGGGEASALLDPSAWAEGPYDLRVTSQDAFGATSTAWLPWYKGDPAPAARRLLNRAAAADPGEAEGAHWRMLAALLTDRAGADLSALADHPETVHSVLMEAAELEQGPAALARPSGFVRLGWIDPVDGSPQYCRAYLPAGYDPARPWPTIVNLHGFNPPNPPYLRFWGVDRRHDPIADRWGVIWIEPHGRANAQYGGIGERDVLNCVDAAKRRLRVDPDRLHLTGESMGGSGTWLIGSRHPDLFATIAPVFGGWDFRLHPGGPFETPSTAMERWMAEAHSSFAAAEQLAHTPVFILHGDADPAVDVAFSRHIAQRLQRWGHDVRYREYPGWGHEDLHYRDDVAQWMLGHRRAEAPRTVRIRSVDLAGASAWWVRIDGAERPLELIEADAEMVEPGRLRIDTRNVARLTLSPPAALRGDAPLRVVWNGRPLDVRLDAAGEGRIALPGAPAGPRLKRAGLDGGLSNVFATPFAIVVGTSARDPEMRRLTREKAERLADLWQSWQHVRPRIVDDTALTPEMERSLSLVLIGGPDANSVSRRLARRLPVRIAADAVTIDGRRFAARDAVLDLVYPSPSADGRYVMLVAGTSAAGLGLWEPGGYWHPIAGFRTNFYDWTLRDARARPDAAGASAERSWIASGLFDQSWRRDDRWTFVGAPAGS